MPASDDRLREADPHHGWTELIALSERFWSKVDDSGDGCWPFLGAVTERGYGRFTIANRMYQAHRVAYELAVGLIPDGMQLDHLCRNRRCCNPAHLEPVTNRENQMRGFGVSGVNARKTHCPQGHEYTPDNLRGSKPYRQCRACSIEQKRAARRRKSQEVAA